LSFHCRMRNTGHVFFKQRRMSALQGSHGILYKAR
jgi:hypothetical protein